MVLVGLDPMARKPRKIKATATGLVQLTFVCEAALARAVDEHAVRLSTPWRRALRSDAMRDLLHRGLGTLTPPSSGGQGEATDRFAVLDLEEDT
jgi:hypothetical protein